MILESVLEKLLGRSSTSTRKRASQLKLGEHREGLFRVGCVPSGTSAVSFIKWTFIACYSLSSLTAGVACAQSSEDTTFKIREVLPICRPASDPKKFLLPFTNNRTETVIIETYTASCVCSKNVSFRSSKVPPGGNTHIEIEFSPPARAPELVRLGFKLGGSTEIDGIRSKIEGSIAEYELSIPVIDPISFQRHGDFVSVIANKASSMQLLISTSQRYEFLDVEVIEPKGVSCSAELSVAQREIGECQVAKLAFSGLDKFLTREKSKRPPHLQFVVYGRQKEKLIPKQLSNMTAKIQWLSSFEVFPKILSIAADDSSVKTVNLVGRSASLDSFRGELLVSAGSRVLSNEEYEISYSTPKWLKVSVKSSALHGCETLWFEVPSKGWKLRVDLESSDNGKKK